MKLGGTLLLLLLGLAGCAQKGGQERDADRLYLAGDFAPALRIYAPLAAATDEPRLWGKAAAAALRAGQLDSAAKAFDALASSDPSRRAEVSDGLAEVARQAMRTHQLGALQDAVAALARIAPERPVTVFAYALVRGGKLQPAPLARMLPLAMAGAPDAGTFDSLLLQYGALMAQRLDCADAAYAYRAVVRRSTDAAMDDSAAAGYATCALRLGLAALDSNEAMDADRWFGRASRADRTGWTGRRALVGLGDARLRQGDPIAAAIAWQRVITDGEADDSLGRMAKERLATLAPGGNAGGTPTMDSR